MRFSLKSIFTYVLALFISNHFCLSKANGTHFPLNELPDELKLEIMSYKGVAKALFGVNESFNTLAYNCSLQDHIQHGIPSSEELAKMKRLLPVVKLKFQACVQDIYRLKHVVILDISDMFLEKDVAIALERIPSIKQLHLGPNHSGEFYSRAIKLFLQDPMASDAFLKAIIKDPNHSHSCDAAQRLLGRSSPYSNDKRVAAKALRKVLNNKAHPQYKEVVLTLFDCGDPEDLRMIEPILSECIKDVSFEHRYELAQKLFQDNNISNKSAAESVLIEHAQSHIDACHVLIESDSVVGKKVAKATLRRAVQDKSRTDRFEAAKILFSAGDEDDRTVTKALLIEAARDRANYCCFRSASSLFKYGNEDCQSIARPILIQMAHDASDQCNREAAQVLFDSGQEQDRNDVASIIIGAVQDTKYYRRFEAALSLFRFGGSECKSVAAPVLMEVSRENTGHCEYRYQVEADTKQFRAACALFNTSVDEQRRFGRAVLIEIARNKTHHLRQNAAQTLFDLGSQADKKIATALSSLIEFDEANPNTNVSPCDLFEAGNLNVRETLAPFLIELAQDKANKYGRFHAANSLFEAGNDDEKRIAKVAFVDIYKDRALNYHIALGILFRAGTNDTVAKPIIMEAVQDKAHSFHYEAASTLFLSRNDDDKRVARPMLIDIAQNKASSTRFDAAQHLFCYGNDDDKRVALPVLMNIFQQKEHPRCNTSASILFRSENEDVKRAVAPRLIEIAQSEEKAARFYAARDLFEAGDEDDRRVARPILLEIVQRKTKRFQYEASKSLFYKGNDDDKRVARPILIEAIHAKKHYKRFGAAQALLDTGNVDDKKLALATFKNISQDKEGSYHLESADILFDEGTDDDRRFALPLLIEASEGQSLNSKPSKRTIKYVFDAICFRLSEKGNLPRLPFARTGLSGEEPTHTWTTAKEVTMKIPTFYKGKRIKGLSFKSTGALASESYDQIVTVFLDKERIAEFVYVLPHSPTHTINVSIPFKNCLERELLFLIPKTTRPINIDPTNLDPRELGIAFTEVEVKF